MKLLTAPTPTSTEPAPVPAPAQDTVRRAPSQLTVPSLDDGSAAASASLDQVASYVGMLHSALGESPDFYARLVKRGFLDSAIDFTRYALSVVDYDKSLDNDGFEGLVQGAVLEALLAARGMGTPSITEPNLADELRMAGAAASNAARGLQSLLNPR